MTLHLVAGYAGTGKDTLFNAIKAGAKVVPVAGEYKHEAETKWLIYALPATPLPAYNANLERVGFADTLKVEALAAVGIHTPFAEYEPVKDRLILPNGKVLRQHYIDHGAEKRAIDLDYWCKAALGTKIQGTIDIYVSDFRFQNEERWAKGNFANCQTTRLYRSEVKVPAATIQSEHDLDRTVTDYLFVPTVADHAKAVAIWPQYHLHQLRGQLR